MSCEGGSGWPRTGAGPEREPRLDWFTELWWIIFRWPGDQREAARRDVNEDERRRKACGG